MRERDIEKYLVERVKALGGEVRKVKWIGRNGAPDRLVMLPAPVHFLATEIEAVAAMARQEDWGAPCANTIRGLSRTIWVELKATGKKPEPHQLREHKRMRDMGQRVVVIDSIEGVDGLLS